MSDGPEIDEVLKDFLVESHENLDQLDRGLVLLEEDPANAQLLASIFRTVHTIKGTCGFLGLAKLERVAHVGESLLARLRDGALLLDTEITSGLLAMSDAIRVMLAAIEATGSDGDVDYAPLVRALTALADGRDAGAAPAHEPTTESVESGGDEPIDLATAEPLWESADGRSVATTDTTLRVDVGLLDTLMNLAGELVLARNQILQFATAQKDAGFAATTQRLNVITTELQAGIMRTRMQPIRNVWSKFPRVVRDLGVLVGKQVRIDMEGAATEIDKTILEAIKDPLTHVVRNAVDHGLEDPEGRLAAGKPVEGRLLLRAFHEGGQVHVEIHDDGRGIDLDRIRRHALQHGLATAEQLDRMTDRMVADLIFVPGFSTAEQVTSVSGRGVGMDVVRTNVERIGGTVGIESEPGRGTTVRIKIPLTLAIIPALIVSSGGARYAIPQVSLVELVRLDGEQARTGIEMVRGAPVHRLRGRLLPLVHLDRALGEPASAPRDVVDIVVVQADGRQFGLVVDGITDTEEIVVKPLGHQLRSLRVFAGATIMGDGRVALILDVLGLAQHARIVQEIRDRNVAAPAPGPIEFAGIRQTLLLFGLGVDRRLAIPLSLIARLEEFPRAAIEHAGTQQVVQYRGSIMPLVHLREVLGCGDDDGADPLQVIVYTSGAHSVGLVVDRIIDIADETVTILHQSFREGVLGSAVIQERVTDLLDVHGVIRATDPEFFDRSAA